MYQNITNFFKGLFKGHRSSPKASFGADSYSDWKKVVIVFIVLNILILIWSGYLFWQINQGNIFEVAPTSNVGDEANTRADLKNILNIYDAREKNFEELQQAEPKATDPAL